MVKAFFAVFRAELSRRRLALVAAALLGFLPWLAPQLPGVDGHSPESIRQIGLMLVIYLMAVFGPVAAGVSLFSRELEHGGLGFYFSRPVAAGPLWLGKVAGALFVLVSGIFLALIPSFLLDPELFTYLFGRDDAALKIGPLLGYPEVLAVQILDDFAGPSLR